MDTAGYQCDAKEEGLDRLVQVFSISSILTILTCLTCRILRMKLCMYETGLELDLVEYLKKT